MSNAPYYLDKARAGYGYGHQTVTDAIIKDGLWDAQYQIHMVRKIMRTHVSLSHTHTSLSLIVPFHLSLTYLSFHSIHIPSIPIQGKLCGGNG